MTLERMARGGVYDQLAGGFHRYSVDERWVVPHFEKMLYDNTELLRNYVHGFQSFVRTDFRQTAKEIVAWLDEVMTDRERGGFYASQDADINLDDDGDYFTWTLDEARAVLDAAELDCSLALLGHWRTRRHASQSREERSALQIHDRGSRGCNAADRRKRRAGLSIRRSRKTARRAGEASDAVSSIARFTPVGMRWR